MKQRRQSLAEADTALESLARTLASITRPDGVRAFLEDLCTPAELEAIADRWRVVPLLLAGTPYREIHERTGVSVTTIGRVARTLERGAGGYATALKSEGARAGRASGSRR